MQKHSLEMLKNLVYEYDLRHLQFDYGIIGFWFMLNRMQELVMDILRVLSTPDLEVRKKTLNFALDLISSRNVEEVSLVFLLHIMS